MISGIYQIKNKVNGKIYIGSARDIVDRWKKHKYHLGRNIHGNRYLQRAWNKYGENNFEFTIVEKVTEESFLSEIEQKYLDKMKPYSFVGYNMSHDATAPTRGTKRSEEVKKKISESKKGHIVTEETRRKLSEALKGEKSPNYGKHFVKSKETCRKISEGNKGKIITESQRKKLSEAFKGIKNPNYGKHWKASDATREKISEAMRGTNNPNYGKHRKVSKQTCRKMSESMKGFWINKRINQ